MSQNDSNPPAEAGPQETGVAEIRTPSARHPQNARHGKIARLPLTVRTELNQRLLNGDKGADLVAWLNSRPDVQQVMNAHFAGAELTETNLSRWREGGYQDWLAEESAREAVTALCRQEAAAFEGVSTEVLTQKMAHVMLARLAVELRRVQSMEDDEARFKCLRDMMWGVIFLRRGEAESARLKREENRKAGFLLPQEELEKQFWLWAAQPENKETLRKRLFLSQAEKEAAIDYILADDSPYWAADEEYIRSIGGKLGAKIPEEPLREKAPEEPQKEPCPVRMPEPRHPADGSR